MRQVKEKPSDLDSRAPAYAGYDVYRNFIEKCQNAGQINQDLLFRLLSDNKDTEYGKKFDFANIKTIEEFKEKVPITEYDHYAEAIERMERGEENILTTYPIVYYAVTSGSMGNPKRIPVSQETLDKYEKLVSGIAQFVYDDGIRDIKGRAPHQGKQFTTTVVNFEELENGILSGPISSAIYQKIKPFVPVVMPWPAEVMFPENKKMDHRYLRALYALKEKNLTQLTAPFITALVDTLYYIESNWEMLVENIKNGEIDESIIIDEELRKKFQDELEPDVERAEELRKIFEQGFTEPIIPKIWPKVDFISSTFGSGFKTYAEKMRQYAGEDILFYTNAYSSSESILAISTDFNEENYTFFPDTGFFEFLPVEENEDSKTLNIDELEIGKEYEVIVTNLSGLYRYKLGDVIEVVDYVGESPVIEFKYRRKQSINIAGEKTNEFHLSTIISELEKETEVDVTDYSIYADTEHLPGRYVLFLETYNPVSKDERERFRDICDEELGLINPSYGGKVEGGLLLPMALKFLQPETFYLYRDLLILKGASENQIKPVRVIDTPRKEKFFFNLIDEEEDSETTKL